MDLKYLTETGYFDYCNNFLCERCCKINNAINLKTVTQRHYNLQNFYFVFLTFNFILKFKVSSSSALITAMRSYNSCLLS